MDPRSVAMTTHLPAIHFGRRLDLVRRHFGFDCAIEWLGSFFFFYNRFIESGTQSAWNACTSLSLASFFIIILFWGVGNDVVLDWVRRYERTVAANQNARNGGNQRTNREKEGPKKKNERWSFRLCSMAKFHSTVVLQKKILTSLFLQLFSSFSRWILRCVKLSTNIFFFFGGGWGALSRLSEPKQKKKQKQKTNDETVAHWPPAKAKTAVNSHQQPKEGHRFDPEAAKWRNI